MEINSLCEFMGCDFVAFIAVCTGVLRSFVFAVILTNA